MVRHVVEYDLNVMESVARYVVEIVVEYMGVKRVVGHVVDSLVRHVMASVVSWWRVWSDI